MQLLYVKPELKDLSHGSRIAFVRELRHLSQDKISEYFGLTGECKRRTMTRYEKGDRNPKDNRTRIIAEILNINYNAIKKHDYKNPIDVVYTLICLEELISNYSVNLECIKNLSSDDVLKIQTAIKHQGKTSATGLHKSREDNGIANDESWKTVRRYVRLIYLIPGLLQLVDDTVKYEKNQILTMGIKLAVEISYLTKEEQRYFKVKL